MKRRLAALLIVFLVGATVLADNWPTWRGPAGQGLSEEKNVVFRWSEKENVKWKIPLEHPGNSTPIVWEDKIFLTQANTGGSVRGLLCYSRAEGKLLWKKEISYTEKERSWRPTWYANASPVTDGKRIVVSYGSAGMFCYDLDGNELWKRQDLGKWDHAFGNSASPILYKDLAILWCGVNDKGPPSVLLAVEKETGKAKWEHKETFGSWATPVVAKVADKDHLLVGQSRDVKKSAESEFGYLKGIDPTSGKELWRAQGINSYLYASPLVAKDVAVAMSGYQGAAFAVKLGGTGDIGKDKLWTHPTNPQRIGSGVILGDHVYMVDESGPPRCFDLKSGEELWKAKRPSTAQTWGSMVYADGRLYVLLKNGETIVMAAKPKFELLAKNSLGEAEETNSSLAISKGEIFIRTFKHLYCIANAEKK
jgi:outer membrane protein assembly factor BamB